MKRLLAGGFLLSCTLAFGAVLVAQDKPAPKEHTMTGCVQKGASADTFVLTNTEAKGPKTIGIVESKENLAPHVGHVIAITGTDVPAKEAESAKSKPAKADHYMKVTSIKMVATSCK
ncbi:MAG TPA: hypothetical protein VH740_19765 [Vicinamibacterales bacterium]|jgi:hypothetical protein